MRFVTSVLASLLTASTAFANIATDYDHNVDFGHYKTYSWAAVKTSDFLWDQRVKDAINRELAARGWTQVPSGGEVAVSPPLHNHSE